MRRKDREITDKNAIEEFIAKKTLKIVVWVISRAETIYGREKRHF